MNTKTKFLIVVSVLIGLVLCNCDFSSDPGNSSSSSSSDDDPIIISPSTVTLAQGETQKFTTNIGWANWSLSGAAGNSSINSDGLLTVGVDEVAAKLTVTASRSYYTTGTATVTVAAPSATPQGLKASKPGPTSIALSWQALSGADEYTVYRSVNGTSFGQIGRTSTTSYIDTAVNEGSKYYYRISAKGVNSNVIFAFAGDYFNMPTFAHKKLIPLVASARHYYRFAVTAGSSYTIEWQNGNNQDTPYNLTVAAYQNNGTQIFSRGGWSDGYTDPAIFTATGTGFVTVEVFNNTSSRHNYQINFYGSDGGAEDSGTVALPPYQVSSFRSAPSPTLINLIWDPVSDAVKYTIYRSNTQTATLNRIGESTTTSYTDNYVSPGIPYWYTIVAVNTDGRESCLFQGAFGYAATHYDLPPRTNIRTFSVGAGGKQYYRLVVTAGATYTIEWQDGNNQDTPYNLAVAAYQNNGTQIFNRGGWSHGYTNPAIFTATATGFVTIEVFNNTSSNQNYQIYYY